ncbi:P-loop NTPase fold protein [Bradyrhizobium sp. 6(2017)]|uniref:P-loop NTPase fold protein n=1 Tax=Bradyrhizobium sp. 6(2017) TaxID=1197460 RepID=UPI0013E1D623|nr:P-loop NTPase fold protein [Bradyrhizobium sp. 6(2017)]QIG95512.1 hypothetical protein G6P99_25995 [Bradyrhizobium sp. 6(2017)]
MAIKQFSDELARFLASKDPEVLCITGKWGVGKTFAWNLYLHEAQGKGKVALSKYSYVSLFGQNSLEDVRYALFENSIPSNLVGKKADLSTLQSSIETILGNWRGAFKFGKYIPKVGDFAEGIGKLGFINVRTQIVCIDDLERAGAGLQTKDILGLVSFLKEQRDSKIVLLMNDEAFAEEAGADFRSQLEKVADTVLRFEPTAIEAAEVGIDSSTIFQEWLKADCIGLGIVNIRVIKRIERFARRLEEELRSVDSRVLQQAIHSAALFIFAKFQPDSAPSLEFIRNFNPYEGLFDKSSPEKPQHAGWRALIKQFGFTHVDEFDAVILQGVEQGRFDAVTLKAAAEKREREFKLSDKDRSFSLAWDAYHDSFENNVDAVLDGMEGAIAKCAQAITPLNLSGTISFLKEMGRGGSTDQLIQQYVDARQEGAEFWDLSKSSFRGEIKDPDVIKAFKRKFDAAAEKPDPDILLERIGTQKGWNPEDVDFLSSLSADDFYKVFKSRRGIDLRRAIYGALMFRDIGNANEKMKTVTKTAEEALRRIGNESPINARRVRNYGISVGADEAGKPQSTD